MTMPPPGWYPDPASQTNIRYWDGQAWTDRVQPKSIPPPPMPGPPAVQQPAAWPAYAPGPQGSAPAPGDAYGTQPPQPGASYGTPPQAPPAGPYGGGPMGDPYGGGPMGDPYGNYPSAAPVALQVGKRGPDGQILAGWWRRVGGYFIDSLVVGIPAAIAWGVTTAVITANGGTIFDSAAWDSLSTTVGDGGSVSNSDFFALFTSGFWTALIVASTVWLVASMINGVYLISRSGQSLGDRVVNTRKVMSGRTAPTLGTALGRWLIPNVLFAGIGNLVPFGFLLGWLNYLWPLWDKQARTLHDMMVRTYVERSDLAGPPVPRR